MKSSDGHPSTFTLGDPRWEVVSLGSPHENQGQSSEGDIEKAGGAH